MKPILLSLFGQEIPSIVIFWGIGFLVFAYFVSKRMIRLKNLNLGFDLVFLTMVLSVLLGRIFFVFDHWNQFQGHWTILPVEESIDGISWFQSMPWALISVWESKINFGMIPIAVLIAGMFLYGLNRYKMSHAIFWSNIWLSLIPAMVIFSIGYLLDGTYYGKPSDLPFSIVYKIDNSSRLALQIIEIIGLLLIWALYLDRFRRKETAYNLLRIFFPLSYFLMLVLLWFQSALYSKQIWILDSFQVFWIATIVIVLFDSFINFLSEGKKEKKTDRTRQIRSVNMPTKYNQSFSTNQAKNKFRLFKTDNGFPKSIE